MIRVAVLGAGVGAQHVAALSILHDDFEVAMIVDQDAERASALRGGTRAQISERLADALEDPDIDLIDICLPPHLHVPVTLDALAAGKHVVCEKPLATALADVDRIEVAAARHDRMVFPVFQYRWGPSLQVLDALIVEGIAGDPLVASAETHWARRADYYEVPWRGTWAGEHGGAVLSHAIHAHDLITRYMGDVDTVSACTATRANPIETEDCAALVMRTDRAALCTSSITLGAATDETRLRFVFDGLTATSGTNPYAPGADKWRFEARDPRKQGAIDAILRAQPETHGSFAGFFSAVALALAGQPGDAVTLADGRASVELVTAIYHAARTGVPSALPIKPDHPLYAGWMP